MPLYEFDCQNCGQSFEKLVRSAAAITEVVCPGCGQPHVQKKLSVFASNSKNSYPASAGTAACARWNLRNSPLSGAVGPTTYRQITGIELGCRPPVYHDLPETNPAVEMGL